MKECNDNNYHSCGGYIKQEARINNMEKELIRLSDKHELNVMEIKEIKEDNKEEMELIKEFIESIKNEIAGFKQLIFVLKWSAITAISTYFVTQVGLIKRIETFLGTM